MWSSEQSAAERAQALSSWYERALRGFLEVHARGEIAQLDDENQRLKRAIGEPRETLVCFVGGAGIGKSTLLNALVAGAGTLVAAGGIGPLTALATEVRFRPVPRLRVEYHPRSHLRNVAASLNFHVRHQQKAQAGTAVGPGQPEPAASTRMSEIIRMAALMVAGGQHEARPVEYLADALSAACGVTSRWGTALSAEDAGRVQRIRQALLLAERGEALMQEQDPASPADAFLGTLREHAAGFLSPLIRRIEVGWPSALLRSGLVLVDLPGVGVASDVYQKETQAFVRGRARAIVLVVGKAGPMEPEMELLRSTGYWDRLLAESDEPEAASCALVLAATHVDDVSHAQWLEQPADGQGRRLRSRREVFADVQEKFRQAMPRQLEQQLLLFTRTESSEPIRRAREQAVAKLMGALQVHPVSAIEHGRLLRDNEDDRSFLKDEAQSGVPGLARALEALADRQQVVRTDTLRRLSRRFAEAIHDQLRTLESACRSGINAAEAARIRATLQAVLDDSQWEYDTLSASFRTFLGEAVPEMITSAAHKASEEARRSISGYLEGLQEVSWGTLRTAVMRGGTYHGARHINLSAAIAVRFQDPVAAAWSQGVLRPMREKTYAHVLEISGLLRQLWDWTEREAPAYLDRDLIQAQRRLAAAQAVQLQDVGTEAILDLRLLMQTKIIEVIWPPIRDACSEFVRKGRHNGWGAKARILDCFRELADTASTRAHAAAVSALQERYERVRAEIQQALDERGNPLERAGKAIQELWEDRLRRGTSEQLLAEIQAIRKEAPWLTEMLGEPERQPTASAA